MGGTKLGGANWEASAYGNDYTNFVFRAAGAAVAVAVLSGAAAERMTFLAWSVLSIVYAGFIYAALTHWTLASGWLKTLGYKDFSGAGVVFFAAGVAGLVVTVLLKPRKFRFDPNTTL
jgi:Amt family ammonium transporter